MPNSNFAPGGYNIEKILGTGGTARVYLARSPQDNRCFALKTILDSNDDDLKLFRSLAAREYELIGTMNYPGLVRIYDFADDPQYPYLSLEYCPGKTLNQLERIESIPALMGLLSSVAINLYYLKLHGIYHGDLKPHNIFLVSDPDNYAGGRLIYSKISDFSLSLKEGEDQSRRLGLGTVGYMAPETIDSGVLTHGSDIFALGVIGYILATGRHPFMEDESDPVRINAAVKETIPEAPDKITDNFPKPLSDLIMSMLDKNPETRPADGFAICKSLEAMGCRYPYAKIIRPKHIPIQADYKNNKYLSLNELYRLDEPTLDRLTAYTGPEENRLRHILEVYFTQGKLIWRDGGMEFCCAADELKLPGRLDRRDRNDFHRLPYSGRKTIILSAMAGGRTEAEAIGIADPDGKDDFITPPLLRYADENVSIQTRRRFTEKIADRAALEYKNYQIASPLYLRAEVLDKAYTATLDASNELTNENRYEHAFELLDRLVALCRRENDIPKLRVVLMQYGDTEKMIGENGRAEEKYREIMSLYKDSPNDKILAEVYKDLGDLYRMKQEFEKGLNALHEAEKIYIELDDQLQLSHTLNNIANILAMLGRFDESLINYRNTLRIQHRLEVWQAVASTLNNMGGLYFFQGRYSRTLKLFEIALKLQREIGNAGEIARTLNNLGCVYQETAQFDEAINCLNESLGHNRKIGSKRELLINLDNLTAVMYMAGCLKDSIKYIREGLGLARELTDKPMLAIFNHHLGLVQKRMGFYGQSMQTFAKALDCFSEIDDLAHESACRAEQADLYLRMNEVDKAKELLSALKEKTGGTEDKKIHIIHSCLSSIINEDIAEAQKAVDTAKEVNTPAAIEQAKLRLAQVITGTGEPSAAGEILKELAGSYSVKNPNIENALFYNIYGGYLMSSGRYDEALEYYKTSFKQATANSLRPEMIDALAGIGSINIVRREYEEGYRNLRQAINIIRNMADDIKDEQHKKKFMTSGKIVSMAGEVKKLSQILAQKKRAGV